MFVGAGTVLNACTIVAGGTVGTLAGHRIPERLRVTVMDALGLFVCIYGVRVAVTSSFAGTAAPDFGVVIIGLLAGAVVGSLLDLDGRMVQLGAVVERLVLRRGAAGGDEPLPGGSGRVARGFVATTLLFCIGPVTILGSFNDGAHGDLLLLGIKSGLDGMASLAFAITFGWGVLLSAGSVLVVQGALTAAAYASRGALDAYLITQALGAGGVLMVAIGLGLLDVRRIRVADLLPALALAPLIAAASRHWGWGL